MEFWLKQDEKEFRLPVNPEVFEHSMGKLNMIVNVSDVGEVNLLGKSRLSEINIESFFPYQEYYFCEYSGFPDPYKCVNLIKEFMNRGQVRLLITETDINKIYYIEDFRYGERDGSRDVYYSISLREYKPIKVKTISKSNNVNPKVDTIISTKPRQGNTDKVVPKTYTVQEKDTLWDISKRFYGNGSKYIELAKKNNIKNPNNITSGQVIIL